MVWYVLAADGKRVVEIIKGADYSFAEEIAFRHHGPRVMVISKQDWIRDEIARCLREIDGCRTCMATIHRWKFLPRFFLFYFIRLVHGEHQICQHPVEAKRVYLPERVSAALQKHHGSD